MFLSALKKFLSPMKKSPIRRQMKKPAFRVESLEDRTVPSSVTVGTGGSIQAAVNSSSSGETIYVSAGTYNQTVILPSSKTGISLVAEGTVTLDPATATQVTLSGVNVGGAAIDVYGTNDVVNGFTVNGSSANGSLWFGIRVIEGGSATIKNNTVEGILNASNAITDVGIQIGISSQILGVTSGGTAKVNNNTVFDYAGAGIEADGSGASASIDGNCITGRGTANNGVAEYGVQVSDFASARVQGNTIEENTLTGKAAAPGNPPTTSAGVFVYNDSGKDTVVALNYIAMNDDGVLVQSTDSSTCGFGIQVVNNDVHENYGYAGIFVLSSKNIEVSCNDVSSNLTYNGIALNFSSGCVVNSNDVYSNGISGSETDGIYDQNGSGDQILANNSYANTGNGINLVSTSCDNLFNNITWDNTISGIQDYQGSNNAIWLGDAVSNDSDGIYLYYTTGDTVVGNVLALNGGWGLQVIGATNTFIAENLIVENSSGNISITSSTGTVLINNWTTNPPTKDGASGMNGNSNSFNNCFSDADNACAGLCN